MSTEQDRDLKEIFRLRQEVKKFFFLSLPGFLWFLGTFTAGGVGQKIAEGVAQHHPIPEALQLAIPFALWLFPFEMSEKNMETLKQRLRTHIRTYGNNPIDEYTKIEYLVNFVMKLFWDKSPLPPQTKKTDSL